MNISDKKFLRSFDFVILSEGGTNNDPIDRGGETKYGISQKQYPDLVIKNITKEDAKKIYYSDYWSKNKCYILSPDLATVVFDTSVNCGVSSTAKWIQNSCNKLGSKLKIDGVIGSHSTLEIIKHSPSLLLELVLAERLRRYVYLIQEYPEQMKYIAGWINRVANLIDFVSINKINLY